MKLEDELRQVIFESVYHKMLLNVIYTGNWIEGKNTSELRKYDITNQQYNILRILKGQHPKCANISLIQERMLDRRSDASRIVERLRLKGLVERYLDENNRRQVKVTITQKGLDLLDDICKNSLTSEQYQRLISQDEAVLINNILDKIRN